MSELIAPRIERLPAVLARTGMSRSSLYLALAKNAFPKPIKLSSRAIGFISAEVDAWIAERATRRDGMSA